MTIQVRASLLLLGLGLGLSSGVAVGVVVQPGGSLIVGAINKPDGFGLLVDEGIDVGAGVPELSVEAVLDHEELREDEDLDDPAHEVEGDGDHAVGEEGQFYLALALVDVVLVVPDDVAVRVEGTAWELDFDELDDVIAEEQHDGSIEEVVDEAHRPNAHVEQVLPVVVHQHAHQVLFVELRSFQHSEKGDQGGEEGHDQGVLGVDDAHQ
jgi:hypothetical protein